MDREVFHLVNPFWYVLCKYLSIVILHRTHGTCWRIYVSVNCVILGWGNGLTWFTCRIRSLLTIASLFQTLINVLSSGILPVEKVSIKCKSSVKGHYVSCLNIRLLTITLWRSTKSNIAQSHHTCDSVANKQTLCVTSPWWCATNGEIVIITMTSLWARWRLKSPDQRKHQSSASLAFVRGIYRYRWIPHTKGQ